MTDNTIDIDAIRPLVERYPTATNRYQMDLALKIAEASPALLAEVDRLREQVESFSALLNQTQDQLGEAREQLFAQNPVIDAAQAWAEMREMDDVTPTEARHLAGKLSDAIEQYRLMDLALTSARDEAVTR